MGTDLVTKKEYKDYVGIKGDGQDDSISSLVPMISNLVKNYCRTTFIDYVDDAKIEIYNGSYDRIFLKEHPVIAITSAEVSEDYGQTYTDLVEFTDYVLDYESNSLVTLNSAGTFPFLINGYKITYTAGYEDGAPEDLKLAIFDLITYYLKNDAVTHSLRTPMSQTMQLEYVNAGSFPSHIARVLNLYKLSWD